MSPRQKAAGVIIAGLTVITIVVGSYLITTSVTGGNDSVASTSSATSAPVTTTQEQARPEPTEATATSAVESPPPPRTSSEAPAVPKPPMGLTPPTPNFAAIEYGAELITLFGRITLPAPQRWNGAPGDPEMVVVFSDQTTCVGSVAECPAIQFVNLESPYAAEYFGDDPVAQWKSESCRGSSRFPIEGPAVLTLGGGTAQYFQHRCNGTETEYLWFVPVRQLLVIGTPGAKGTVSAGILQAVLERIQ